MYKRFVHAVIGVAVLVVSMSAAADAQTQAQQPDQGQAQHTQMNMAPTGWQFMHDGLVYGLFNHQGGPRGGNEFRAPNWWMGMLTRKMGSSQLTVNGMFSLDPATAGKRGYREIFQVGEAVAGMPLIDRQHPHDLFMQLAGVWRIPVRSTTGFTIAGGPVGEPALGPVAFMHRASAADNLFAPLSHHTFDSTHIAFGVVTAAVDHGPWVIEGSVFNGREPDENRWDFDFGALDSVSGRVWFRPNEQWEFQGSTGHLKHPEELEPGNIQRTTTSGSWFRRDGANFIALTVGYGLNATDEGKRQAVFGEATRHRGMNSVFGRIEVLQVETAVLWAGRVPTASASQGVTLPPSCPSLVRCVDGSQRNTVGAFTAGGARDIVHWHGFEGGLGAMLTFYAVPDLLTVTHGKHPVSFQVYFRLRPPAGSMGRMWNMRMSQPMAGHQMQMDHAIP